MKQFPFSVILNARDRFITKSKFEIDRARQLGLELQPSPDGAYLVDPKIDRVVASPRSNAYYLALYGGQREITTTVVEFESVWDEGTVTTQAVLNLLTGEVTDIEVSDEGADYEHLQYQEIRDVSRGVSAIVVTNDENQYFLEDLTMLAQFGGAEFARPVQSQPRG